MKKILLGILFCLLTISLHSQNSVDDNKTPGDYLILSAEDQLWSYACFSFALGVSMVDRFYLVEEDLRIVSYSFVGMGIILHFTSILNKKEQVYY